MPVNYKATAALMGGTGVVMGAFGAHALKGLLTVSALVPSLGLTYTMVMLPGSCATLDAPTDSARNAHVDVSTAMAGYPSLQSVPS